ncbi:hypothetical protein SLS56_011206 [Neofusicoccum ribis]|uniref:Uncharacterized protein n=1 Tax=Neofusicoccum ribis TaxID=45134 RepID=A0ABR3SCA0_9PEZI
MRARDIPNQQKRNVLMCETIIECLRSLDWEYAEIAKSEAGLTKILGRYVDLKALSKKKETPQEEIAAEETPQEEVAVDEGEVQEENAMHLDGIYLSDFDGPFTLDANTVPEISNPPDLNIFGGIGNFRFDANTGLDIFNVPDTNYFDGIGNFTFDPETGLDILDTSDVNHF